MDFSKLSIIFTIIVIGIVYIIIFTALKIMNKDISSKDTVVRNRQPNNNVNKSNTVSGLGLEVINPGENVRLKRGGVIPLKNGLTIGRNEENMLVLNDTYVSSHHARIFFYNGRYILEDMKSTNGTMINGDRISGKVYLNKDSELKIGTAIFKVIG